MRPHCTSLYHIKKIKDKYKISALELLRRYKEEIGKPHVIINIR